MDCVAGTPLTDCLSGDDRHTALQSAARALARLHEVSGVNAPARSTESLLEEAESTGRFLARLVPDLHTTLDQVLKKLHDSAAESVTCARAGFVHGDFYHGQVLIDHAQTALLDFDRSYLGDVVADLGNFGAHMHLMERQGRISDSAGAFNDFMSAYQDAAGFRLSPAHVKLWQTYGLLQLAVRPFRTFEPSWAESMKAGVADCLRAIS
jgi:aminoglycoside phosphotransferase (APT) family kinase protein